MTFTTLVRSRKRPTLTAAAPRAPGAGTRAMPRREILHLKTAGPDAAIAAPADGAT